MELNTLLTAERKRIEAALDAALLSTSETSDGAWGMTAFQAALRHAVKGGGKRIRPILTLLCARTCGASPQQEADALKAAVAIELLHNYTLAHDDLPCMDNDTERRGAPSVWVKFGEGDAVLAGDFLQALAFSQLAECHQAARLLPVFAKAARQVIGGQVADITAAQKPAGSWSPTLLDYVFRNKTAALIETACGLGAIAAEAAPECCQALMDYGQAVGLAFQYVDDLLDARQAEQGNELNAIAVLGGNLEAVRKAAEACTHRAKQALVCIPGDTSPLSAFADALLARLV